MMYTRYRYAADLGAGKRILEVGSGSGQGLGIIARKASLAIGGDFDPRLVAAGGAHYRGRVPFVRLSAEALPFKSGSFDVVLMFEASYYVPDMNQAFDEFARVAGPKGTIVFVNANPERPDFIPSPHSNHYHTADEFRAALETRGFRVSVEGAFRVEEKRFVGKALSTARTVLSRFGLVPRTLWARAILKRLVYGKLQRLPEELPENYAPEGKRWSHAGGPLRDAKVFYVTARR